MSIFDDTGQSPSITEGPRSLRLFTDRRHLIRVFARALHEDDALGKILFLRGGGGNGKSLLLRFLQQYACKRFFDWDGLTHLPDAEFVGRLRQNDPSFHTTFHPLPVAHLDFHAPPRELEQPTVDYDALLMIRRQLGAFRAEGFTRLRFPVYDFAAVWYLHQTGRLTQERLSTLFPDEEINFVGALAQVVNEIPGAGVAQAVLALFNEHLGEWWTLFRHRRAVDSRELIQEIQEMDPERDLIPEMPRLFAKDLNAALATPGAPPRIILLADGHEVFSGPNGDSGVGIDRDRWLRHLLGNLHLQAGIVPVITSRQEPHWADRAQDAIPTRYLDPRPVGHFSDADAATYLAKAGVDDPALRARLCDYARVAPDEIHPLYAGLGADIVLQAIQQQRRLTVEDFPDRLPDEAQRKRQVLVDRLLREARRDVGYAVRSLAAARAFDRELFEELGSRERSRYSATDAAFDTLTRFSFVWEAQGRESGWYSIHTLLRRVFREREDERTREADAVLEAIYGERAEAGDALALAEVAYHAYQLEPERGLQAWAEAFEEARKRSQYALCEALRTVGAEFRTEEPGWRARIAREEGEYLLARARYAEAEGVLRASVSASDEAIRRAPNDAHAYSNKGVALRALGDLLAAVSRHEESEGSYTDAVAAFDAALDRAPGDPPALNNKANALAALGNLFVTLSRYEEAESALSGAVAALDEVLSHAPDHPLVHNNKANALSTLGDLLVSLSRYNEAEKTYTDAVAALDQALGHAFDDPRLHANKGGALGSLADLLARRARYEEAERAHADAVAAFDEALDRAPDNLHVYNRKANALFTQGKLLAILSRYQGAERAFVGAVAAADEALGRAPDYTGAYDTKGKALQSYGDLLARFSRHQEAEVALGDAVAAFDAALGRAPDDIYAYNNKGIALHSLGDLFARHFRYEEAEEAFGDAVTALDEALRRAPDYVGAYASKGDVLRSLGDLLARRSRDQRAEETYTDAVTAFDGALDRAPDDNRNHNNKGVALRALADLLSRLSRDQEAEGDYADAVAAFDAALGRAPDDVYAYGNKGGALRSLGDLLVSLSRYEEAERAYTDAVDALDAALGRAPDYVEGHSNKGIALRSYGGLLASLSRYEEAEAAFRDAVDALDAALSRAPDDTRAYVHKGTTLIALGDLLAALSRYQAAEGAFSDAAGALDEVLSRIPDDADLHLLKALTLVSQGKLVRVLGAREHVVRALWEEARSHAERVLSLVPHQQAAVSLLAQIRDLLGSL